MDDPEQQAELAAMVAAVVAAAHTYNLAQCARRIRECADHSLENHKCEDVHRVLCAVAHRLDDLHQKATGLAKHLAQLDTPGPIQ